MTAMKTVAARVVVGAACITFVALTLLLNPQDRSDRRSFLPATSTPAGQLDLLVQDDEGTWRQPMAVYPVAILAGLGVSAELAHRSWGALAGVLTMLLTFTLVKRAVREGELWIAASAVMLLLIAPGFVMQAQVSGAQLLLAPLLLVWLSVVLTPSPSASAATAFCGGLALGACIYTQPAGVLTVPIFFALGAVVLAPSKARRVEILFGAAGVVVAVAPMIFRFAITPDDYPDSFGRWAIHAAHLRNPWDGLVAATRWHVMARRVSEYWHYLNPTFVFGRELLGLIAVLLVPLGMWQLSRTAPVAARVILIGGVFAAPLAAVLLDTPRDALSTPMLLPLGAALGAFGVAAAATRGRRWLSH